MQEPPDPAAELTSAFGPAGPVSLAVAPGRVNLIGEHVDYHGLAVLPMALERRIRIAFRSRQDRHVRVISAGPWGAREFEWTPELNPVTAGDWENYLRAAAQIVGRKWGAGAGVDAAVVSDLPSAAGLASSSALLVAFTLALLRANGRAAGFEELMEVLPDGEQFVGTRGGGMDHAAVLVSNAGCATLIEFEPLSVRHIPLPSDWSFLVAHSLDAAEKSGAARGEYNARRRAGTAALQSLGYSSYRSVPLEKAEALAARLANEQQRGAFLHVTGEALRVREAVSAMERHDAAAFGRLLNESHASLRDRLRVSSPALDRLVKSAVDSGALGARLTGAGFGGCAVVLCAREKRAVVRRRLIQRFYASRPEFIEELHLIDGEPGDGAIRLAASA
jgi:galactokinase